MDRRTHKEDRITALEQRMLSGKPFSYAGLVADRWDPPGLVYRMIKRLRREGRLSVKKIGRRVSYVATV